MYTNRPGYRGGGPGPLWLPQGGPPWPPGPPWPTAPPLAAGCFVTLGRQAKKGKNILGCPVQGGAQNISHAACAAQILAPPGKIPRSGPVHRWGEVRVTQRALEPVPRDKHQHTTSSGRLVRDFTCYPTTVPPRRVGRHFSATLLPKKFNCICCWNINAYQL